MISCKKRSAVSAVFFVFREIDQNSTFFFAAKGRIGHNHIYTISVANLAQWEAGVER